MTDKRMKQMMQEALDEALKPEERQELFAYLDSDRLAGGEFRRLKQVDALLASAPFERAPTRLALSIMARVADEVKAQQSPNISSLALALGLAMVTVVMMPMLTIASWLVLNTMADPAVLARLIQHMVALLIVLVKAMQVLLDEAQSLIATDPERAQLVMALVPLTLLGFVRYMQENLDGGSDAA